MTRKVFALFLLAGIAACDPPPPIEEGKCVVLEYRSQYPYQQRCVYHGYNWSCIGKDCVNMGEATGELSR